MPPGAWRRKKPSSFMHRYRPIPTLPEALEQVRLATDRDSPPAEEPWLGADERQEYGNDFRRKHGERPDGGNAQHLAAPQLRRGLTRITR